MELKINKVERLTTVSVYVEIKLKGSAASVAGACDMYKCSNSGQWHVAGCAIEDWASPSLVYAIDDSPNRAATIDDLQYRLTQQMNARQQ